MFFDIITAIILAVVQGLTEFLPVSSSGHLAIGAALLGSKGASGGGNLIFEVAVHVGTLGAVAAIYRRRIRALFESALSFASSGFRPVGKHREGMSYIGLMALGSVPAAVVGLLFRDRIAALFDSPAVVSILLVGTGFFLLSSRGRSGSSPITPGRALLIGMAQAVAILPGCSRSGWTITMALLAGIGFEKARPRRSSFCSYRRLSLLPPGSRH
ncbi:MAG: undecaprenyl-diphosphate phosphatase [Candidatus Krumholzibacteria bacterium]|nr:undecaprenyl-diphosphate phosphatase [Candidatus Krumholzibacteria bacterium]